MYATPFSGWLGLCPHGHAASGEMPRVGARNLRSVGLAEHSNVQQLPEMKHLSRGWKRNQSGSG